MITKMSPTHQLLIIFLFAVWVSASSGSLKLKLLQNRSVVISGPKDVTVLQRGSTSIVVTWYLPEIYVSHDPSNEKFANLKNGDKIDVVKPHINHVAVDTGTNGTTNANSTETNDDDVNQTTDGSTGKDENDGIKILPHTPSKADNVECRPLSYFSNFTVKEKTAGVRDNGWAESLLEADDDLPVTNMSLFYLTKDHLVVGFEEGCVTKMVVTYHRNDMRPEASTDIVLNATDHVVIIDGLKAATTYKIVVSAYFVGSKAISAKAIFVTTLTSGQPETCRCDWHGTKNHTSSCANPSNSRQHCECSNGYAGRFCESCAYGFYRDSLDHGCKPCPCDEHGAVKTSCGFKEGFLMCDKCAEGYTGNTCHKCAAGYFRMGTKCHPCQCNGNTKRAAPLACHPASGACIDCQYNTTGFYCERCLPGYWRRPANKTGVCIHHSDLDGRPSPPATSSSKSSSLSPGIIGAIIFASILCITVIVGIVVCRRVRENRQRRALWTVEMRPDNDDLDFNTVHNDDAHMDEVDDMQFYEKHGGRSKTSGKYSKLTEDC